MKILTLVIISQENVAELANGLLNSHAMNTKKFEDKPIDLLMIPLGNTVQIRSLRSENPGNRVMNRLNYMICAFEVIICHFV